MTEIKIVMVHLRHGGVRVQLDTDKTNADVFEADSEWEAVRKLAQALRALVEGD